MPLHLPYRYQTLQHNDSIRILVLHPSLTDSDPIICTMQYARLSDAAHRYEALSYTWGDTTQQQEIQFNTGRRKLRVGKHCCDALRRLRQGYSDRLLWVDAICINQEDLAERAHQVRLMGSVFSCAFGVVVFLGEQVTNCRALFDELAAADELLRVGQDCCRPSPSDIIVQELEKLFELPWFKRVWVLQEVCAKKSVTIMYGSAIALFEAVTKLYFGYCSTTRVTRTIWPLPLEWVLRPPEESWAPQVNLWQRLFESRRCLATDPRDRVFALLSLTGRRQSELNSLIDYTHSLEDCFTQVATFLVPVLGLRLLSAIRHPHEMEMPSWVPDWSQNLPLGPEEVKILTPVDEQKCKIRSVPDKEEESYLELLVTGCRYAQVVERSCVFHFDGAEDGEEQMKSLYYSLDNLREFVDVEGLQVDVTMTGKLEQKITDGK